jgi:hypothetical protein
MIEAFNNDNVINTIELYFKKHHELYKQKINGVLWEELSYNSFRDNNYDVSWDTNSHRKGTDLELDGVLLSYKSGKLIHKKKINRMFYEYSGSRLTSFKTLNEKVDFLKKSDEHYIVFLCSNPSEKNVIYKIHYMDKSKIPYDSIVWDTNNINTIVGTHESGFSCKIQKKMSDQIWYKIPYEWLTKVKEFNIPINIINNNEQ